MPFDSKEAPQLPACIATAAASTLALHLHAKPAHRIQYLG